MDELEKMLLMQVADLHRVPDGAYNIRKNGEGDGRRSTDRIRIEDRKDGHAGIDIFIAPDTKNESVHIPVVITKTDYRERVYNDFYIGENADVLIIAGCGIHNCGVETSEHTGVHTFHIGRGAKVRYVEKHYGSGDGSGENIMNPATVIYQEEDSRFEMESTQIKGIDSTDRETTATLKAGAAPSSSCARRSSRTANSSRAPTSSSTSTARARASISCPVRWRRTIPARRSARASTATRLATGIRSATPSSWTAPA